MDFRDTTEEAAFRDEVRAFLRQELPGGWQGETDPREQRADGEERYQQWMKKLASRGWIAPAWPKEYGGAGLSVKEQFVFNEEMARARAPRPGGIGVGMAGPTIIVYGTDEQKQQHLSGILSGEVTWCQLYSEPGAGSDLAALQTRAVRDGDDYVVNGQKIWTSGAHRAQRGILLARTDPDAPKHKGISYFLLDMKTPGISIRPLVNMAGTHEFNEVFFDNVRIPKRDLLGEENRGWYMATTTLDFERSSIGNAVGMEQMVEDLLNFVHANRNEPFMAVGHTPSVRYELADRRIEVAVAMLMSYRIITMQSQGMIPNHEASCAKLFSTELTQRIARTGLKLIGTYGQLERGSPWAPLRGRFERMYLRSVSATIAGGTSEIQRNIIAMRGLGLPRG
ncbi:MAG TPA: acyl-CoA dehydrogenase family protein [Dehalococcoidia bacterium]|nr:acyl-CoA dehydrogenase family protein [Dehalococcoidia bacterium]